MCEEQCDKSINNDSDLCKRLSDKPIMARRLIKYIDIAEKNREFEIKNYWVRTGFFAAIVSIAFSSLTNSTIGEDTLLKFIVISFGTICSLCWVLGNHGAKYWQNNWELKANKLTGNYYKITEIASELSVFGAKRYSVSKAIIMLSYFTLFLWIILLYNLLQQTILFKSYPYLCNIAAIVLIPIILFLISYSVRSENKSNYNPDQSEYLSKRIGCLLYNPSPNSNHSEEPEKKLHIRMSGLLFILCFLASIISLFAS